MNNEFSLIKKIISISKKNPSLIVPPGDDAALLHSIQNPVISTDTQRENIHFKREWLSAEEIGFKAVAVTLSDLAASYARPVALFINLGIPGYISEDFIEKIYLGINKGLSLYNCAMGGGNISASNELSLDLFVIGNGDTASFPLRSNAKAGNGLFVTGHLGLARAGLDALFRSASGFESLIKYFKQPKARFDASAILKSNQVNCVMDISDGLAGDAEHIAAASNISIEFTMAEKNLSQELLNYCLSFNLDSLEMALGGGEDYELLFTCSDETFKKIEKDIPSAFRVGNCLPFCGSHILNPPKKFISFQHK